MPKTIRFLAYSSAASSAGLHDAHGPAGRLHPAHRKALHLQVEAPIQPLILAYQRAGGHPEPVEDELERVHSPIANGGNRLPAQHPAVLPVLELVPGEGGLFHHEHRQPPVPGASGPAQHHQQLRAAGEGAPQLRAADFPVPAGKPGRPARDAGDVRAVAGLGDRHGNHLLAGRDGRQPPLLLVLGPSPEQGPDEDLGPGDQAAADGERGPGQFLGGDQHGLAILGLLGAAVLGRHRQAKQAQRGRARNDAIGDVEVPAVDVLGVRADLPLGEVAQGRAQEAVILARPDVFQRREPARDAGEAQVGLHRVGRAASREEAAGLVLRDRRQLGRDRMTAGGGPLRHRAPCFAVRVCPHEVIDLDLMGVRSLRRDRRRHMTSQAVQQADTHVVSAAHPLLQARRHGKLLTSPGIALAMQAS